MKPRLPCLLDFAFRSPCLAANVIFAALIGVFFFADRYDWLTLVGIVLTIASAIVIIQLQAQRQRITS